MRTGTKTQTNHHHHQQQQQTAPSFSGKELKKQSEEQNSKMLHVILTWPLASD